MNPDGAPALSVAADLRLVVDGTHATLCADRNQVTVRTDNAGHLIAAALESVRAVPITGAQTGGLPRESAARISRLLDDSGLAARVVGSHGTVLVMGRGCQSLPARLFLRGAPITLGSGSALLWTAAEYARATVQRSRLRHALVATAAVLLVGIGARRLSRASYVSSRGHGH